MSLEAILVIAHVFGTAFGVGGATLAEVQYVRALKDGTVDTSERRMLHATYWLIRLGLGLIIISGLALVWVNLSEGATWVIMSPKLWAKDVITGVIVVNAVLLSWRKIPMWLGASLSLTSWYTATVLGLWRGVPFTFGEILLGYAAAVLVVAGILEVIRRTYLKTD